MNRFLLLLFLVVFYNVSFGQVAEVGDNVRRNDFFIDPVTLILGPIVNVGYERLLSSDIGVGVHGLAGLGALDERYQVSPYIRMYFGSKFAEGFFLEGFVPVTSSKEESYRSYPVGEYNEWMAEVITNRETTVGLGVGLGGKWVLKRNLLFELGGGVARRFAYNGTEEPLTGKWMIGIGYRF